MNKSLQLSRLLLITFLLACTHSAVLGQEKSAQMNATSHSAAPQMPATFPTVRNTGNPQLDAQNYAEAKKAWIETHKEEYIQMQPGLSEEGKRLFHSANSNDNLKENNLHYLGASQPKMADFANEMDFHLANKAWIAANGEINAAPVQSETNEMQTNLQKKKMDSIKKEEVVEVKTESAEESVEYRQKLAWILANEAEYRKMVSKEEADEAIRKAKKLK